MSKDSVNIVTESYREQTRTCGEKTFPGVLCTSLSFLILENDVFLFCNLRNVFLVQVEHAAARPLKLLHPFSKINVLRNVRGNGSLWNNGWSTWRQICYRKFACIYCKQTNFTAFFLFSKQSYRWRNFILIYIQTWHVLFSYLTGIKFCYCCCRPVADFEALPRKKSVRPRWMAPLWYECALFWCLSK